MSCSWETREGLAISPRSYGAYPAFLAEAFASLDMTPMGVATSFAAATGANPDPLKVFSNPFVPHGARLHRSETHRIY